MTLLFILYTATKLLYTLNFTLLFKEPRSIGKKRMITVLVAEDDFIGRNAPVDTKGWVVPCYGAFGLRGIEVVALVLEDDFVSKDGESMCETSWDEELTVVVFGELYGYVLPERW